MTDTKDPRRIATQTDLLPHMWEEACAMAMHAMDEGLALASETIVELEKMQTSATLDVAALAARKNRGSGNTANDFIVGSRGASKGDHSHVRARSDHSTNDVHVARLFGARSCDSDFSFRFP